MASNPCWVAKTRTQAGAGLLRAAKDTIAGRAFFAGAGWSVVLGVVHTCTMFELEQRFAVVGPRASTAMASAVATTLTYSLQTVRTRAQAGLAWSIASLYAGFGAHIARSIVSWTIKRDVLVRLTDAGA